MSESKNVLVIDDEQQLVIALKVRLESQGYQVETAANGQEGLNRVDGKCPDIILLDILMPVMDGYSFLRELNSRVGRGKIPVIVLTARDRMKDLFELEGIVDYVVKPFDHEDLLIRIKRALSGPTENPPSA